MGIRKISVSYISVSYITVILFAAVVLKPAAVLAFDERAIQSIKQNKSSVFQADGIPFGGFLLRPSMTLAGQYDSNVFRQEDDEKSDFITRIKPELRVDTNWNLHQVSFGARGEIGLYSDLSDENYEDHTYFLSGRYDLGYDHFVNAFLRADYLHEDRGDLDDVGGDKPIEFLARTAGVGYAREIGILKLYLDWQYRSLDYDDSRVGAMRIDNSIRDRDHVLYKGKLAYSLSDDYAVFVQAEYNERDYDLSSQSFRNSDGYAYSAGFSVNLTGKVQADAYVGHLTQKYDEDVFRDVKGMTFGGSVLWNINDLTSLEAEVDRDVVETILAGSSAVLRSRGAVRVEHALRENLYLDGRIGVIDDTYEGNSGSSDRDNTTYEAGVGMEYAINPLLSAGVRYDLADRKSDNRNNEYTTHKALFSLKVQY